MSHMNMTQSIVAAVLSFVVVLLLDMFVFAGAVQWVTVIGIALGIGLGFLLGGLYRHRKEERS